MSSALLGVYKVLLNLFPASPFQLHASIEIRLPFAIDAAEGEGRGLIALAVGPAFDSTYDDSGHSFCDGFIAVMADLCV